MNETKLNETAASTNNGAVSQGGNETSNRKSTENVENGQVINAPDEAKPALVDRQTADDKMTDEHEAMPADALSEGKQATNGGSSDRNVTGELTTENNNVAKGPTDRGDKAADSPAPAAACGWCHDTRSPLNYILPTLSGESLEFCTEMCIVEFRKAVKKGACKQCGNAIRSMVAPNRDYCSTLCHNKAKPKNGNFCVCHSIR